jgi:hypothetical protein
MSKFRSLYVPEGILIIVSILIAFAIDAWWEERQYRAEERRILEALRVEFQENADQLPAYIQVRESDAEHARTIVEEIQAVGNGAKVRVTPEQLEALTIHGSFDAVRGAFDTMLHSGDLRFIENQELRMRLVLWPTLIADAVENDYFLRTIAGPRAFEYLAARVDLGLADQIIRCESEKLLKDCPSANFELEATRELSGIVSHIRGWSEESAAELELVRQDALSLVQALDEELVKK